MSPLRILQIIPNLAKGGAERLVLDICHEFSRRSEVQYRLISLSHENKYLHLSSGLDMELVSSSAMVKLPGKVVAYSHELDEVIEDFHPHVIHSHVFYADMVSRQKLYPAVAYFSHVHGRTTQYEPVPITGFLKKEGWIQWITRKNILRQYLRCSNHIIANSAFIGEYVSRSLHLKTDDITVMLNAINLARFRPVSRNYPGNALKLVFTGSLEERKNPLLLPQIIKELLQRGITAYLDVLGDGTLRHALEEQIATLQLENSIKLHGHVENVEEFLANAHMYIHTAVYEPFGLALVEAMATGLPVVCLDGKGNREVMENGFNGFIIERSNAKEFADKIMEVIRDEQTYYRFSLNAQTYAKQFGIAEYVTRLIELYHARLRKLSTSSMNAG